MLASIEEAISTKNKIIEDKKTAEYYLIHYEKELKKYKEEREEYINKKDSAKGGNGISKPTEWAAIKGVEFDGKYAAYKWLKAIEIVQRWSGERKNIFIKVRRDAEKNNGGKVGRKGWVAFTQSKYTEEIEYRFAEKEKVKSEQTLKIWWKNIVNLTVFTANKIHF